MNKIKKFLKKYIKEIKLITAGGVGVILVLTSEGMKLIPIYFSIVGGVSVLLKLLKPIIVKSKNKIDDKVYNFMKVFIEIMDNYVALNNNDNDLHIKLKK